MGFSRRPGKDLVRFMNITLFRATKRPNSSTYQAAKYLISKLSDVGTVYEFTLPEDMPHICLGCYACINGKEDKCGGYAYLEKINRAMDDSELLIFCAPVWCFHAPGQIKSFLDHYGYRWMVHRPNFAMLHKQAVIISTAGGGGLKETPKDIKDSMDYWGVARTYVVTQAVWGGFWNNMSEKFKTNLLHKLDKTAVRIEKHAKHLTPSLKVKALYKMFERLHLQGKMLPVDDSYWKETLKK